MTTTKELCSLCTEETGRAGSNEDSIYICPGLPCEVGPICETCYNSFAEFFATEDRELLTIAYMSDQSDASKVFRNEKIELVEILGEIVADGEMCVKKTGKIISWLDRAGDVLRRTTI